MIDNGDYIKETAHNCECGHSTDAHDQTPSGEMGCDLCFCIGYREAE